MQKLLLDLETAVRSLQPVMEPRKYDSLCRAYLSLRENFSFSTPFGRCPRPVVQDMEKRISDRLLRVLHHVAGPGALGEDGIEHDISEMLNITELIKNREKLIVG